MYVHCKEGTGRSVAVTLCWLVAAREMDSLAAQEYLSGKRHVRKVALLASRCPDGVLPRRRKKLWILSDQKLRVENVNALLDIHMANFERYMIEKMKLARSHSFYHAKGLGLFAVPCQSIAKLYTANVGHLKGAAQLADLGTRNSRTLCCVPTASVAQAAAQVAAQVVAQVFFFLTWPLTYLSQRQKYWTLVDSHVLLGAASTAFLPHVDAPAACGVDAVVNLRDEYACPMEQYKRHHIQQLQLPTVDHFSPSLEALTAAVAFI
uniref:Tyrosine specific protein phosphatases domain-containing protein n=1 Tax=Peronospora matthiolae TaxID=2874970 RepID=A0AAV1UDV0_9STRA